jgi:oligosaccharide repeat unit polymerase
MAVLKHPISLFLIAFILTQALSVYYGGIGAMVDEISFWYIYPVFVLVIALSINTTDQLRKALWGTIIGAGFVVAYGIYALYNHFTYELFGVERVMDKAMAYGMYANHNDYTFIIILILPFIVKLRSIERSSVKRLFLLVMAIASVVGIFLSLSRGGIVALFLEALLIVHYYKNKSFRPILRVLLLVLGIAAIGYQFAAREATDDADYTTSRAEYVRLELWRTGYKMVKANPILGVGSRRFSEYSRDYTDLSQSNIGLNSHNTYVEVISTSGILGFICFAGMLRAMLKALKSHDESSDDVNLSLMREGILISLIALMVRSFFDAKPHEWGLYLLAAFALAYVRLWNAGRRGAAKTAVTAVP